MTNNTLDKEIDLILEDCYQSGFINGTWAFPDRRGDNSREPTPKGLNNKKLKSLIQTREKKTAAWLTC